MDKEEELEMMEKIDRELKKENYNNNGAEVVKESPISEEQYEDYYRRHPEDEPMIRRWKRKREQAKAERFASRRYYERKFEEERRKARVRGSNLRAELRAKKYEKTPGERAVAFLVGSKKPAKQSTGSKQHHKTRYSPKPVIVKVGYPHGQKKKAKKTSSRNVGFSQPDMGNLLGSMDPNRSSGGKNKKKKYRPPDFGDLLGL